MGISSNQARFLALTSRQVDLEFRVQQICQRRLRLSSELENVATSYNNQISNRQMYAMNTTNSGISNLTINHTATSLGITELRGTQNGNSVLTVLAKDSGGAYRTVWYQSGEITDSTGTNIHITRNSLGLPTTATEAELTAAALKAGQIMIAKQADEYTQTKTNVNSVDYEIIDWRTMPELADELYKGDDVDAENKYDKIVSEINAQDKKLQLEQTSIEVEYKAVSSEKESVKKILDTNATASFKYFS